MDLSAALLRAAAARPHVLLVEMPGGTAARLAAERELRVRDLPAAATPADAAIVLVAGPRVPSLGAAVDRLVRDTPSPRARVHAAVPEEVGPALAAARGRLVGASGRRAAAAYGDDGSSRPRGAGRGRDGGHGGPVPGGRGPGRGGDGSGGSGGQGGREETGDGTGHDGRGSSDGGGRGNGHGGDTPDGRSGHAEHHDHGEAPAGRSMAEVGDDRDGLALDRLHVTLGPLLCDWPAGLVVRAVLQGDVIQRADVDVSAWRDAGPGASFWTEPWRRAAAGEPVTAGEGARRRAAGRLDRLARLLAVAGWPAAAVAARRLRDDLLDGAAGPAVRRRAERLHRRVGRSRTLYWLTRGTGRLPGAGEDVPDRYRAWLDTVREDVGRLAEPGPLGEPAEAPSPAPAVLAELLAGAELAAARLVVAALAPEPEGAARG
ncbi:hypothetical protein [Streptomyces sp. CC77]|uniref:hypothetical protein n=1 Tax=Streptomyces sp. CC77 TaxID=1906739 RepID=UPI0008DE6749|nr:hypothetical protein [Streptomyces sp. CC77]OII67287.1 hypothetical protein BJP39_25420 [Streptomyces sp. CC77]